jgi:16S rRNA G966 N2-methylase RsmD
MNNTLSRNDAKKLDYPYYNLSYKLDKKHIKDIVKYFEPIILDKPINGFHLEKFNNFYFIIKDLWDKNSELNYLTDYFSEEARVKCVFGNYLSPYNYWKKNKEYVIYEAIKKYKKLNIFNMKEIIFDKTKLCNNFRISVSLVILKYFKAKRWLDISAGWGDRLLSGLLYGIKRYVSADPNKDLQPHYKKMIETFSTKSKFNNFKIYKDGFENIDLGNELFDIVFSSPPFFTLEKYSNYNENSITKYGNEQLWCEKFLLVTLVKCYNNLKKNGHIILYMGGSKYVMEQMHRLDKVAKYCGTIYFYDNKPRGMFVWKKIRNDKINIL